MMKQLIVISLLTITYFDAVAWNARGHMIIAAIAWDNLDEGSQESATAILINHPEYSDNWKKKYEDYQKDMPVGKFLMMQAATWPDQIRNYNNRGNEYHHGPWHYITYEMRKKPDPAGGIETNTALKRNKKGDVLYGIDLARQMVAHPHISDEQKAIYFAWLIHLIGDIHQPLHCATLFDAADLAKGDRGGNKIYIRPNKAGVKLHSFWDGLLGSSKNARTATNDGKLIARENPKSTIDELAVNNPQKWSFESLKLAAEKAHLDGLLVITTDKELAEKPPSDYNKESKRVARRRAAMAGYRLALDIDNLVNL